VANLNFGFHAAAQTDFVDALEGKKKIPRAMTPSE
jgi:hypothetical protein